MSLLFFSDVNVLAVIFFVLKFRVARVLHYKDKLCVIDDWMVADVGFLGISMKMEIRL